MWHQIERRVVLPPPSIQLHPTLRESGERFWNDVLSQSAVFATLLWILLTLAESMGRVSDTLGIGFNNEEVYLTKPPEMFAIAMPLRLLEI